MIKKQRKTLGLRAKIKNYMEDVSIDIFDHEKKVTENLSHYFDTISKQNKIPASNINIRISKPHDELVVHIHHLDKQLRQATFKELVNFFMGEGTSVLFEMEATIRQNAGNYFRQYAKANDLSIHALNIRISKPSDKILAVVYNHLELIDSIPLKELIKYFKG